MLFLCAPISQSYLSKSFLLYSKNAFSKKKAVYNLKSQTQKNKEINKFSKEVDTKGT